MHPIERLRFVARASGADPATLVYEAANGMAAFVDDPVSLVTVCRRVIDRQPAVGPLWWLCARVLTEPDPRVAARRCLEEMAEDSTAEHTADALPDGATVVVVGWPNTVGDILARRGDMRALVVDTLGEGSGLVRGLRRVGVEAEDVRSAGLAAAVSDASLVILEASAIGPESALCVAGSHAAAAVASTRMADSMRQRLEDRGAPWEADDEFVPLNVVTQICSVAGPEPVASALQRIDCPIAPELLRRTAF
jgi:hypothetical protein